MTARGLQLLDRAALVAAIQSAMPAETVYSRDYGGRVAIAPDVDELADVVLADLERQLGEHPDLLDELARRGLQAAAVDAGSASLAPVGGRVRDYVLELPRWDQKDWQSRREVWDVLHANHRGGRDFGRRQRVTRFVISTTMTLARAAKIQPAAHLTVELVWAPERANRNRDADNLWPLLKVLCDALARGPIKRAGDKPGLDLVPDDTPQHMTKRSPRIATPSEHAPGLWLHVTTHYPAPEELPAP